MRADQAKTINISEYLQYVEGVTPEKTRMNGHELWYCSPIRDGDKTPSFKVDTVKNLWYDHGNLSGGNVLDLVIAIRQCTVSEALSILEYSGLYRGGITRIAFKYRPKNPQTQIQTNQKISSANEKEKNAPLQIIAVGELENFSLLEYIRSRAIDPTIAKKYLKQVKFRPQGKLAEYFAVGFKNGDGYEVRNKYFKGFAGLNKDVELLNPKINGELIIFEGFMDFLAYLTYLKEYKNIEELGISVAIMNSITMKNQLIDKIEQYDFKKIYSFLDNDEAGKVALSRLQSALPNKDILDKSNIFSPHKDFNDFLLHLKNKIKNSNKIN